MAREIAKNGPVALRAAKQAINLGTESSLAEGLAVEGMCYTQVMPTRDRIEGLKAFAEKREPHFTGE